jgi:hypothetical protein
MMLQYRTLLVTAEKLEKPIQALHSDLVSARGWSDKILAK